jgi:WD40-like Beta Propeller Repeat
MSVQFFCRHVSLLRRAAVVLATLALASCTSDHSLFKTQAQFSETVLCPYQKDGMGGFSPYWVAYIVSPAENAKDQLSFVKLNGKTFGPYAQVSGIAQVSRDGKHIAFAALENQSWIVVVDGVKKYTHEGLMWPWASWSPSLEGNTFIPQTRAAVLEFSPDGKSIAYPARTPDGKYAVYVNGKPGPSYPTVGSALVFVSGRVRYYAFPEEKKIVEVDSDRVLGPYDSATRTEVSPDEKHYCFAATIGDKNLLVVDGEARELPGPVGNYVVGNDGFVAYTYKSSGKYHVRVANSDLPGEFDEVQTLTVSPDNKQVAFWGLRSGKWTLWAMGKEFPGFDGYYVYQAGARRYCVMWGPDSQHIAYYVRDGNERALVLDGQKLGTSFGIPGIALQVIVDDQGREVGVGLMSAPPVDTESFVQALLMRGKTKCDPVSAVLMGQTLTCVEKNGAATTMHIGEKTEGPFRSIRSALFAWDQAKHYAYLAQTEKGQQFVVDGTLTPHVYEAIYRPILDEQITALVYLAVKDGNLIRVVQPVPSN